MNIDFKLKLPLVNKEDNNDTITLTVSSQLLLSPLYALEEDVISPFSNIEDSKFPWIRKLLFNASITVYRLTKFLEKISIISQEDLFLLRRDFVICIVTNEIAKQMNKDFAASSSRSKSLGDFSVSVANKGDNTILLQIIRDSSNCIEEMKHTINGLEQTSVLPKSFIKGRYNPKTSKSNRLWWHSELGTNLIDGYASKKYYLNDKGYKAGGFNLDYYSKYSRMSVSDYYSTLSSNEGDSNA